MRHSNPQETRLSFEEQDRLIEALAQLERTLTAEALVLARAYGARSSCARLAGRLARQVATLRGVVEDERQREVSPWLAPDADGIDAPDRIAPAAAEALAG